MLKKRILIVTDECGTRFIDIDEPIGITRKPTLWERIVKHFKG